jgi:thiamine biosynthesis lipoprotein ApbE
VSLDLRAGTVTRPPGLRFDSGGIAKGLFCDILAGVLELHPGFAIDCAGDVRVGGAVGLTRPVQVASPFDDSILHTFELTAGAAATSGIGRRSWLDAQGRPAHHLLDPASGRPAFTGIVQVTAVAPTAVEAEVLTKTTLSMTTVASRSARPHRRRLGRRIPGSSLTQDSQCSRRSLSGARARLLGINGPRVTSACDLTTNQESAPS